MIELMNYYHSDNDRKNVLKYIEMASNKTMALVHWIRYVQFAIGYSFECTQLTQPVIEVGHFDCGLQPSICHFFGIGAPKSIQQAVDVLQTVGFGSCSARFAFDYPDNYRIVANVSMFVS